jgi:hypothetical protein
MYTQNEIALKILNMGKDGYKNDAEGFEKLNLANDLIKNHVIEQFSLQENRHLKELLLEAYKEGFDSATDSLLAANKMVQDRILPKTKSSDRLNLNDEIK